MTYFSFLICRHPKQIDIYYNGVPLGLIREGVFVPHQFKLLDGTGRSVGLNQLPEPCPFNSVDELKAELSQIVSTIQLAEPTP